MSDSLRRWPSQPTRFVLVLLMLAVGAGPAWGQQALPDRAVPASGPERDAYEALHGPDLEGSDGPLSAASFDLLTLYFRYRAEGEAAFEDAPTAMRITNGGVVVDAIARRGQTGALRADLEALGLRRPADAGRVVSGVLPVDRIADAARLDALQSLRPAYAQTQSRVPTPSLHRDPNSSEADASAPDSASPDTRPSASLSPDSCAAQASSSTGASSDDGSPDAKPRADTGAGTDDPTRSPSPDTTTPTASTPMDTARAEGASPTGTDGGWGPLWVGGAVGMLGLAVFLWMWGRRG